MTGRFFDEIEKMYMEKFKDNKLLILDFYDSNRIEEYHALLQMAIDRGSAIVEDEIILFVGEEIYYHNIEIFDGLAGYK